MGGSSSKRTFFWQKKKSPLQKAWSELKVALPNKKRKRKSILSLDKLNLDNLRKEKHSLKRFSLPTDKKQPTPLKRFSLGNMRKELIQTDPPGKKQKGGGGPGKAGEQMKRKFSQETKEEKEAKNGTKVSKKRLNDIMRSIRPTGSKADGQFRPNEL